MTKSITLIEEILANKISNDNKKKLELYLINGPLNDIEKDKLLRIISELLDSK